MLLKKCLPTLLLITLTQAYADNLNFQSKQECIDTMRKLENKAMINTDSQYDYWNFFYGLAKFNNTKQNSDCNHSTHQCTFALTSYACSLLNVAAYKIDDPTHSLWQQVVPTVQREIDNYNQFIQWDSNHGVAYLTCPYTEGQAINALECKVELK